MKKAMFIIVAIFIIFASCEKEEHGNIDYPVKLELNNTLWKGESFNLSFYDTDVKVVSFDNGDVIFNSIRKFTYSHPIIIIERLIDSDNFRLEVESNFIKMFELESGMLIDTLNKQ